MAVRVKTKGDTVQPQQAPSSLKVPAIAPPSTPTPNIIIRAVKIMLMDIRVKLYPKQTADELAKYSQFADYAHGRK